MHSDCSLNYVFAAFISIILIQGGVGLASATPSATLSSRAQAVTAPLAGQTTNRPSTRRRSRRRRGGTSSGRSIATATSTNDSATIDPTPRGGVAIGPPTNDKTSLDETLEYIKVRLLEYGGQSGYSGGEILKDVTYSGCSLPTSAEQEGGATIPQLNDGGEAPSPSPFKNCSISWVVTFKEAGSNAAEITRTTTLKLRDLNPDDGAVVWKGVIWLKTYPYRSITVTTTPGASNIITEDEWWIDLHDEVVAQRVARALQHAAKNHCREKTYVEKFTK